MDAWVAIIVGSFALLGTALTVGGTVRAASRQREPQMITASQQVLTTTIEALTNEVRRKGETITALEIDNYALRRQLDDCLRNCGS